MVTIFFGGGGVNRVDVNKKICLRWNHFLHVQSQTHFDPSSVF